MKKPIMTNDQLKAFIAVVEQGSFRAAAVHLFKTQPTVSAAVQTLEQQFDFKLLSREGYRPTLTTQGKAFYRQAKQLLAQIQQLEHLGHQLAQKVAPTLSICLSPICANPAKLEPISHFCEENPDIQLNISAEHLYGVQEQLELDNADLAIGPRYGLDDRHEIFELSQIDTITVAAPGYIPFSEQRAIRHNEIQHYPHILIASSGSTPSEHLNVLPFGQRWYVNDYQMKKALLIAGMGWARIPRHMIEHELATGELIPFEVEQFNSRSQVPVYLIRLRHQPMSDLADKFWKSLLNG